MMAVKTEKKQRKETKQGNDVHMHDIAN